jgi:hypothetical protein
MTHLPKVILHGATNQVQNHVLTKYPFSSTLKYWRIKMPLETSPSFEEVSNNNLKSSKPEKSHHPTRVILIIITLIVLGLLGATFMQDGLPTAIRRKGIISGSAVNESGQAIPVEVLVYKTDIWVQSDANGKFFVEGVPAGEQSIIVAYDRIAAEVKIDIQPGVENSLGTVIVPTELLEEATQ